MRLLSLWLLIGFSILSYGQQAPTYYIKKTAAKITLDGVLDEPIWHKTKSIKDFQQQFPNDQIKAISQTEVKMTYNDKYIYVAAICYDDLPGDYIIQSLKRDFSFPVSDAFAIFINPTGDNINGFSFAVNPFGAQREGVLVRGGVYGVTTSWDNIWYSAVKREEGQWVVEMKIPFTSIRYSQEKLDWKINFSRNDLKRNEVSTWVPVPVNQNVANLSYTGNLVWDLEPPSTGLNAAFIPYGTYIIQNDYENDIRDFIPQAGADGKIAITSNLNLDLTINPDFSQVDVDVQQINLTQFNLYFPEQRKFFMENADLFDQYGFTQIRPFYSRRVGQNTQRISSGIRLTGKLDENWRVGLMNVQAKGVQRSIQDTSFAQDENYTIATFQRKIGAASDIGLIFLNQTGLGNNYFNDINWNRIIGAEYNLASKDRKWIGEAFYHYSFQPFQNRNSFTHASFLRYQTAKLNWNWNHEYVGNNYTATMGFIPRQNWSKYDPIRQTYNTYKYTYWRLEPSAEYFFYPSSKLIFKHGPGIYYSDYRDEKLNPTDIRLSAYYLISFLKGSNLKFIGDYTNKRLLFPFYISGTSEAPLPVDTYEANEAKIEFTSSQRNLLFYGGLVSYGTFFNGKKLSFNGNINYKIQPWGIISATISYNDIELPTPYTSTNLTLVGAKAELSFTKNLYFTSFLQYNTQSDNMNIYNRLQFRFLPMSDLFIVYSDNYDVNLDRKNNIFVLKLVLWLNS